MLIDDEVDLVILGAGCAGLSLAARLADSGFAGSVLAIEPRTSYVDDRSWCFWRPDRHDLEHLVSRRWPSWTFSGADGRSATSSVPGVSYQYVRSSDFYADALARIGASGSVRLQLESEATELEPAPGGVVVTVSTPAGVRRVLAREVVDTRPQDGAALMYQCFAGVEIEHPHGLDTGVAGLMTSMLADAAGLGFTYLLPLSPTRALVEWTRFSAVPLERAETTEGLDRVLASLGLQDAPVIRHEGAALLMGSAAARDSPIPGVVLAGMGGGALRAASGYAFLRIQAWAESCATSLLGGDPAIGHPAEPWDRREMDRIFLQALLARPHDSARYFLAMAERVPPARLVRFLSDQATPLDYAAIIASLPLTPFLAQLPRRSPIARVAEAAVR